MEIRIAAMEQLIKRLTKGTNVLHEENKTLKNKNQDLVHDGDPNASEFQGIDQGNPPKKRKKALNGWGLGGEV